MKFKLLKYRWWQYLILITLLLFAARMVEKYIDSQYGGKRTPYLQMLGQNQVTIKWQGLTKEKIILRYGLDKNQLKQQQVEQSAKKYHSFSLQNLASNSQYYYQIKQQIYSFKTIPNIDFKEDMFFWVLGDPGEAGNLALKVKKSAYAWFGTKTGRTNFDLILTTGDNAYRSGTNQQYQDAIFDVHAQQLSAVNIWPAYGNHDARRWAFFDIFDFPEQGELGGVPSNTERYYSFNYGNVHFVILNSEISAFMHSNNMIDWLEQDLMQNTQRWTIALFHSPPYSKGSHNSDRFRDSWGKMVYMREKVLPILEKYGTDMVLSGHSHTYERSHLITCHYGNSQSFNAKMVIDNEGAYQKNINKYANDGSLYAVVGSSSKHNGNVALDHPALQVVKNSAGSMIIKIKDNNLYGYFINDQTQLLDSFHISKTKTVKMAQSCDRLGL